MRKLALSVLCLFVALLPSRGSAQVCDGLNTAGRFATCTDATAANIDVSKATAGTLPTGRGGTGLTTFGAAGAILYSSSASVLAALPFATNGYFLQLVAGLPAWSSTLGVANGGLGLTSTIAGGVPYGA